MKQIDLRTFDEDDDQELDQFLRNGNFEEVIVVSTWAAREGDAGRVPVGVEFDYVNEDDADT